MSKEEKFIKKIGDPEYIKIISDKYLSNKKEIFLNITRQGQPENYVRERYTGRGNRFYNAKEALMKEMKKEILGMIELTKMQELQTLIQNKNAIYYVYIDIDFYLKIPSGDSIETTILKEKNIIKPAIRPDIDNYLKLTVDVLHDIVYDDDKRLVEANSKKIYSINPRTEIRIRIEVIKE